MVSLDPYATLGVARDADDKAINAAYRQRAKETHPDKDGGSKDAFSTVNRSKLILLDPERRKRYDETGDTEDPPPECSIDLAAWGMIGGLLHQAIAQKSDPMKVDIIGEARKSFEKQIKDSAEAVTELRKRQKMARAFAKRFKRKSEGENRLQRMVEHQILDMDRHIENAERVSKQCQRAIELLEDYDFEKDEMPVTRTLFINTGMNSASTSTSTGGF